MEPISNNECEEICNMAGVAPVDTNIEHVQAFIAALRIYDERRATRGDTWREGGVRDSALLAKVKAIRIEAAVGYITDEKKREVVLDDALDLCNYGLFCARLVDA
jgi:hypothetical protein